MSKSYDNEKHEASSYAATQALTAVGMNQYDTAAVEFTYDVVSPSAATFLAGESEISTMTFEAKASMVEGEYLVVYDTAGLAWAIAADISGTAEEPTGAIWVAIPAARKAQVDLSGTSTAASVAAAFETAFDALTGFSDVIVTDDTAGDGTMTFTQVVRGPATTPVSKLQDDSGSGGITITETNPGVSSVVGVTNNTLTKVAHGFSSGLKVAATSSSTLPAGLSVTNYYVIKVDADTIKLATSAALALVGTPVDITDQGTDGATHTLTPAAISGASIKLQESVDGSSWFDISGATGNITADGSALIQVTTKCGQIRPYLTMAAGQVTLTSVWNKKG